MFSKWIDESEFDGKNDFFDNSVMSVRQWLAVMSVMIIPVVNVVMIFCWAFAEKEITNSNKVNWARASVIALTANAVSGAREMYMEKGFDDYMSKPINGKLLDSLGIPALPQQELGTCSIAVQQMVAGDTWEVYIPAKLGYGDYESGFIPAYSTLIFEINLVAFGPVDAPLPK